MQFDYATAFARNIGFLSEVEQERLRGTRVAIAGLGGTGGAQVHGLARMGIGAFNLADPDTFELINFNRQLGATMATIGRHKVEVCEEIVHGINPDAEVRLFPSGIAPDNIHEFLTDVDVIVDSLDFYCFEARFLLYAAARERGLWVLTAPPLGFGFTLLVFDPKGMRFEDYFGFSKGMPERELVIALIAGVAPKPFLMRYLSLSETEMKQGSMPSVGAAPMMIAGVIATEVVNQITRKTPPLAVPTVIQYDALLRKFRRRTYPLGMRGPIQTLKKAILRKKPALRPYKRSGTPWTQPDRRGTTIWMQNGI